MNMVPYITSWSAEEQPWGKIIERGRSGIRFADETLVDRDEHGILWRRVLSSPGKGRPQFGKVHPLRQRRAMRRLLCQVCAGPADHSGLGTLWLLPKFQETWPQWPEGMAATEPPICLGCARLSIRVCPTLRTSHAIIRVGRSTISGIYGIQYRAGDTRPIAIRDVVLGYDDPAIPWTCAGQLVRELRDCTMMEL